MSVTQVGAEWVGEATERSSATERCHISWQWRLQLQSSQRCRRRRQQRVHSQPSSRYDQLLSLVAKLLNVRDELPHHAFENCVGYLLYTMHVFITGSKTFYFCFTTWRPLYWLSPRKNVSFTAPTFSTFSSDFDSTFISAITLEGQMRL